MNTKTKPNTEPLQTMGVLKTIDQKQQSLATVWILKNGQLEKGYFAS